MWEWISLLVNGIEITIQGYKQKRRIQYFKEYGFIEIPSSDLSMIVKVRKTDLIVYSTGILLDPKSEKKITTLPELYNILVEFGCETHYFEDGIEHTSENEKIGIEN